ncbi:MAG: hypothetical protein N2314_03975 [Brevinematales bacterium]|nr:hypothetical protein [Brevinematales bacterium]
MKQRWVICLFLLSLQGGMGWEIFAEYTHTMSALGKDHLFRGGITTPLWRGWAFSAYGEANVFFGIPTGGTGGTRSFGYRGAGIDLLYRNTTLEDIQPYARFGCCWVWPSEEMTSSSFSSGIRGGVGMVFLPWQKVGLSVGVDFTGLMEGGRAEKILTTPVYHQGVQIAGSVFWRL